MARVVRRRPAERHCARQPHNRICLGFFLVSPSSCLGCYDNDNDNDNYTVSPTNTGTPGRLGPSPGDNTPRVQRSSDSDSDSDSDCRPSAPPMIQALFVDPHGPWCRVVAWMRAVRRRPSANVIVVGDSAAAAGYLVLVVELGLTPRSAWLRIAGGISPMGDLVLAWLCALAIVHNENEKGKGKEVDDGSVAGAQAVACASLGEEGHTGCEYWQFSGSPHSCQSVRVRAQGSCYLACKVIFSTGLIMSKEYLVGDGLT
jgi:hypothetical protein